MNSADLACECWFLSGATATGKTGVGLELARRIDAEIISLDSMAVYRGMDIGTAKPTPDHRSEARHHLIDIRDSWEDFSVAEYVELAYAAIADIRARGRQVLFVGGTPLYLKVLLRGLDDMPRADWNFRRQIEQEIRAHGSDVLYERVKQIDPLAAAHLHPSDTRRLIRALEVYTTTGTPLSHLQMAFEEGSPAEACRVFILRRERGRLHARIDQRVKRMFERGLIEEVQRLVDHAHGLGRTASQAVGYREVIDCLQNRCTLEETTARIKQRTRRFAKRQETWFRSLTECQFIDLDEDTTAACAAERILGLAGN